MHEDEIRNLVVEAGEPMPSTSRTAIRASLVAALEQTPVHEAPGLASGAEEPATTNVVTLRPTEPSDAPRHGARGRRSRWIALIGAGAVAAAAVGVLLVRREPEPASITGTVPTAPSNPSSTPTNPTSTPTTPSSTPPTAPPPTVPPTTVPIALPDGATLPAGVGVESISFPTVTDGWVVGHRDDGSVSFQHTTDGGLTWTEVAPPAALTASGELGGTFTVAFADAENGWLNGAGVSGSMVLLSTHDGGATWNPVSLAAASEPVKVAFGAGQVHVVAFDGGTDPVALRVYTASVDGDDFVESPVSIQPGAGPVFDAQFAFAGDRGWLVYNDRVFSGSARYVDGAWVEWQAPCTTDQVASVGASPDGATVLVACSTSTFVAGSATPALWMSADGGATFSAASPLPGTSVTDLAGFVSSVGFVIVPERGVLLVGYSRAYGEIAIARSADAGATWTEPARPGLSDTSAAVLATQVGSGEGAPIVVTASGYAIVSTDGGATWAPLAG